MAGNFRVTLQVSTANSAAQLLQVANAAGVLSASIKQVGQGAARQKSHFSEIARGVFSANAAWAALRQTQQFYLRELQYGERFIRSSINASAEAEKSALRLGGALRAAGDSSAASKQALLDFSGQLQTAFGVADEAVTDVITKFLNLGASQKEVRELTDAALDLSAAFGIKFQDAANLLGKAITGQTRGLERLGFAFDKTASAVQRYQGFLDQLRSRGIDQAAEEQAKGFSSLVSRLTETIGDFQEKVGDLFTQNPAVKAGLEFLIGKFNELGAELQSKFPENIKLVNEFLVSISQQLPGLIRLLSEFTQTMVLLTAYGLALADMFGGLIRQMAEFPNVGLAVIGVLSILTTWFISIGSPTLAFAAAVGIAAAALVTFGASLGLIDPHLLNRTLETLDVLARRAGEGVSGLTKSVQDAAAAVGNSDQLTHLTDRYREAVADLVNLEVAAQALQDPLSQIMNEEQAQAQREVVKAWGDALVELSVQTIAAGGNLTTAVQEFLNAYGLAEEVQRKIASLNLQSPAPTQKPDAGFKTPTATPKLSDAQKEEKRVREKIEALKTEIEIRKSLDASKVRSEELDAQIEAAQIRRKTGIKELGDEFLRLTNIRNAQNEADKRASQAMDEHVERIRSEIPLAQKELELLQSYNPQVETLADFQERVNNELEAYALGLNTSNKEVKDSLRTLQEYNREKRIEAQVTQAKSDIDTAQRNIAILQEAKAAGLGYEDALKRIAIADKAAELGNAGLAAELVNVTDQYEKAAKRMQDTTIDLGQSINDIFGGIVDGILQGTNGGLSAMQAFANAGKAFFADMFKKILIDKLGFDQTFQANFLRELPGVAKDGANAIGKFFSDAFSDVSSSSSSATGSVLDSLSSIGGSLLNAGASLFAGGGAAAAGLGSSAAAAAGLSSSFGAGLTTIGGTGLVAAGGGFSVAGGATLAGTAVGAEIAGTAAGGAGTAAAAGGALAGLGSAAGTAGIAAAVIAAIMTASGIYSLNKTKSFFDSDSYVKALQKSLGGFGKAFDFIGRIATFGQLDFATGYTGAAKLLNGEKASGKEIAAALLDPVAFILAPFINLPTKGTVLRKHFEEFIEDKDLAAGFFARDSGTFKRGIGQEGTRRILETQFPNDNPGDFVLAMREYIKEQQKSLDLTDQQIQQFVGLGVAFRSAIGAQAGSEEQRSLAIVADLLGSITKEGALSAEALDIVKTAIEGLGNPRKVIGDINDFFTSPDNDIAVQDYRNAIQGLAQVWFNDVPLGVRASEIAIQQLDKAITETGEQGVVQFEELANRIADVSAAAEVLAPAVLNAFKAARGGASDKEIKDAFTADVQNAIADAVSEGLVQGFIQTTLNAYVLEPFFATLREQLKGLFEGTITPEDAFSAVSESARDVKSAIAQTMPFLQSVIDLARDINKAFGVGTLSYLDDTATDIVEAAGSLEQAVVDLATGLAKLEIAAQNFNNALEQRIFQLRNKGDLDPEIIKRGLSSVSDEFLALLDKYFPSISTGQRQLAAGDLAGANRSFNVAAGLEQAGTPSERLAALGQLQALAEKDLEIRLAAIYAERDAYIRVHQERIDDLNEEADLIKKNAEKQIDALQKQLDIVNEQITAAEDWKSILEDVSNVIFELQTGNLSGNSAGVRFSVADQEFQKQLAIFNDSSNSLEKRQEAASKLGEIGPQLLDLLSQMGVAQTSERYRIVFDQVVQALQQVQSAASDGSASLESLVAEQTELTKKIKEIQGASQAALDSIDERIEAENKLIKEASEAADAKAAQVSKNTADVLDWIRNQGNEIFQRKQDELKGKLGELGVTDTSIESISAESLGELRRIRKIIEDNNGSTVRSFNEGAYGLSSADQQNIFSNLKDASPGGSTEASLQQLRDASLAQAQGDASMRGLLALIESSFPDVKGNEALIDQVIDAMIAKIQNPNEYQPILGFRYGGVSFKEALARVSEGNTPEVHWPLDRMRPMPVQLVDAVPFGRNATPGQGDSQPGIVVNMNIQIDAKMDLDDPSAIERKLKPIFSKAIAEAITGDPKVRHALQRSDSRVMVGR